METSPHRELILPAIYIRVSSDRQVDEGHGLDAQERACREYIRRKYPDQDPDVEVVAEEPLSGAYTVRQLRRGNEPIRPALSRLIDDAMEGRRNLVVINEISRVSREFTDWILIYNFLLKPAGVKVLVVTGDLDLDDEDDQMIGNLEALFADRERKRTRRRSMDGRHNRLMCGYLPGGHAPFGWRWVASDAVPPGGMRGIEPHPDRAPIVLFMVQKLLEDGWGVGRIARYICEAPPEQFPARRGWTGPEVWSIVRHPVHCGYLRGRNGELIKGAHHEQRLFDLDVHHQIIHALASRATLRTRTLADEDYALLGLLACGHCARRLYAHRSARDVRHYRCEAAEPGEAHDCPGVMRRADLIETRVAARIADLVNSPTMSTLIGDEAAELLKRRQSEGQKKLTRLRRDLEHQDTRLGELGKAFFDDKLMGPEQFQKLSAQWQAEYDDLRAQAQELEARLEHGESDRMLLAGVRAALRDFAATWRRLPPQRLRELLCQLVEYLTLARAEGNSPELILRVKLHFLPEMVERIPSPGKRNPDAEAAERLSLRELAVVAHLADGLSSREMAERMDVGPSAVRVTISRAMCAAGVDNRQALIEVCRARIDELRDILPMEVRSRRGSSHASRGLTAAEARVWALHEEGRTDREVAEILGMSKGGVAGHLSTARRKLGVVAPRKAPVPEAWRDPPVRLGKLQRQAWALRCEGRSHREIAEAMGRSLTSVNSYLSIVKRKLRAYEETRDGSATRSSAEVE